MCCIWLADRMPLPSFVPQSPLARYPHKVTADRRALTFGIMNERAFVIPVPLVRVAERCLPAPLAVAAFVFETSAHVFGELL
jgi:hypothetical protein